jgi:transcriptional regulator with XRE-family HTH domain
MESYEKIGQRLKEARDRVGLTQEQTANALGILREQLSYYENGRREIDVVSLAKLADLYGYSINYFLEKLEHPKEEILLAFRADQFAPEDLPTIAWVQRFTRNLNDLNHILKQEGNHE